MSVVAFPNACLATRRAFKCRQYGQLCKSRGRATARRHSARSTRGYARAFDSSTVCKRLCAVRAPCEGVCIACRCCAQALTACSRSRDRAAGVRALLHEPHCRGRVPRPKDGVGSHGSARGGCRAQGCWNRAAGAGLPARARTSAAHRLRTWKQCLVQKRAGWSSRKRRVPCIFSHTSRIFRERSNFSLISQTLTQLDMVRLVSDAL